MKLSRHQYELIGLALFLTIAITVLQMKKDDCTSRQILLPDTSSITTEIADIPSEQEKGLSNRTELKQRTGMLFLFSKPDIYIFWMKDTRIPLDIIWLNNHRIVEMATLEPQAGETIPTHTPTNTADAVLEINKGEAAKLGLALGSELRWQPCQTK